MPAKSKKQQRFMGMIHAYQKGELKNASPSVKKAAKSIDPDDVEHFARTKHKGLPEKVKKKKKNEGVMLFSDYVLLEQFGGIGRGGDNMEGEKKYLAVIFGGGNGPKAWTHDGWFEKKGSEEEVDTILDQIEKDGNTYHGRPVRTAIKVDKKFYKKIKKLRDEQSG